MQGKIAILAGVVAFIEDCSDPLQMFPKACLQPIRFK